MNTLNLIGRNKELFNDDISDHNLELSNIIKIHILIAQHDLKNLPRDLVFYTYFTSWGY